LIYRATLNIDLLEGAKTSQSAKEAGDEKVAKEPFFRSGGRSILSKINSTSIPIRYEGNGHEIETIQLQDVKEAHSSNIPKWAVKQIENGCTRAALNIHPGAVHGFTLYEVKEKDAVR
jgi:hypothetical protein